MLLLMLQLLVSGLGLPSVFGEGCVFNMTEPTGIITTRDMYSDDNGQAAACAWIIEAPFFHVIQLQFVYIDILLSPNCRDNFIAVYDGNNIVALLCGHYIPPAFQSKRPNIIIMLRKYLMEYQDQFNLTYAHVKAPTCGSHQIDGIGNLTPLDSDGDTLYDNNLSCTWKIVSLKASQMEQVYITKMDIQSSDKCESDFLEVVYKFLVHVYDTSFSVSSNIKLVIETLVLPGNIAIGQILDENKTFGVYCGTQQPPLTETTTSALYLNFHSDSSVNGKGFLAIYAVIDIDRQCGGLLTQPTGSIESVDRNGDGKYDVLLNCAWAIIAPVNSLIELQFLSVNLEYEETCKYDFVQVFDGLDVFRGRYCGFLDVTPHVMRSTSNVLYVEFYSDHDTVAEGFRATYRHIGKFTTFTQSTLYVQSSSKPTSDTSVSTKSSTSNSETQMTHAKSSMATEFTTFTQSTLYVQSSSKPTSDTSVSTKSSTSNSETQMTHAKSSMATDFTTFTQSTLYVQSSSKPTSGTSVPTESSTRNSETQMTHAKNSLITAENRDGQSSTSTDLESSSPFWTSGNHSQVTFKYTTGIKQMASLSKMSTTGTAMPTDSSSLAATGTSTRYSAYLYMLPVVIFAC